MQSKSYRKTYSELQLKHWHTEALTFISNWMKDMDQSLLWRRDVTKKVVILKDGILVIDQLIF